MIQIPTTTPEGCVPMKIFGPSTEASERKVAAMIRSKPGDELEKPILETMAEDAQSAIEDEDPYAAFKNKA